MDSLLCDELVQEIFLRLLPQSFAAVSLVSKRWHRLLRCSITALSIIFPLPYDPSAITLLTSFLSHHPFLSSLSLATASYDYSAADHFLLSVAYSCRKLRNLRYLSNPVNPFTLFSISASCSHLSSLSISLYRPLSLGWLRFLVSLKCLSLFFTNPSTEIDCVTHQMDDLDLDLRLESLSLSGIIPGDYGVGFLWRNCKNVKKLQLKSCESVGDISSFSSFLKSLKDLQHVELRTCRSIVDGVLLKLAETCVSLDHLLVHDGGSKDGLLEFIYQSKSKPKRLDFRLPLDLQNAHLVSLSEKPNFRGLVSIRLRSCCIVTGEGLMEVAKAVSIGLEELGLINCDVVERESGLLTALGQELKCLKKLDLSYNESLMDKEMTSMLASACSNFLNELKLRGCNGLTNACVGSVVRNCKKLGSVDLRCCGGIQMEGIEFLLRNSPAMLRRVKVEQDKVSGAAKNWASEKFIQLTSSESNVRTTQLGCC